MNPIQTFKQAIDTHQPELWKSTINLSKGDILAEKGVVCEWIYFVEKGALQIGVESEDERHIVRFAYEGSLFAPLDSFFRQKASVFFVEAIRKTTVLAMRTIDFKDFIASNPAYTNLWQLVLEELILQQLEREIDLLHQSPAARYKRVLERSPQLFQYIPHKYIATYLRMTPETLSRLKANTELE